MTQHAFPVIDCDLHTIEPVDIWHRYLEKRYHERIPALGIERWSSGRRYDAQSHLQAMDVEGITVAVVFGTHGRHVQMQDDLDPFFAAALARAHNRWTSDY